MNTNNKPHGKIVWLAWSIAMSLLLFYVIDTVFEFNLFTFQVFVAIMMFFIILLLLIILSWILILKNKYDLNGGKFAIVFNKMMKLLEQQSELEKENSEAKNK